MYLIQLATKFTFCKTMQSSAAIYVFELDTIYNSICFIKTAHGYT